MKWLDKVGEALEYGGLRGKLAVAFASGLGLVLSLLSVTICGFDPVWIAILLCGAPICCEATKALATHGDVKSGLLVVLAMSASIYLKEYFAAGEVAFIMALGETLEEWATSHARSEVAAFSSQLPETARVIETNGNVRTARVDELGVGDVVRIAPGEKIPVDGLILRGETTIDEQALSGEATPVDKSVGEPVYSGSINLCGSFDMSVSKVEADSSFQQVVRMALSTDVDAVPTVRLADRWATVFVLCSLATALATYCLTRDLTRAATVLVVFCPCAFVLATPTALLAALSAAFRRGVFLKSCDVFDRLAKVTRIAFDKTGTLTEGRLVVSEVSSLVEDVSTDDVWVLAAALESRSEHPIGRAIASSRENLCEQVSKVEGFNSTPGYGVSGYVDGRKVCVGSDAFLIANGIDPSAFGVKTETSNDAGVVFVGVDGRLIGYLSTSDKIRDSSSRVIAELLGQGMCVSLLSGDSESVVRAVARQLGISDLRWRLSPHEKCAAVDEFRSSGDVVCMVGDGFNDAMALKRADVGVSLGRIGADIAHEASDVVLYRDEIASTSFILALSRRVTRTIKTNLILSTVLNALGVTLALLGFLSPATGALVHNASSLATILNSLRLLSNNKRRQVEEKVGTPGKTGAALFAREIA